MTTGALPVAPRIAIAKGSTLASRRLAANSLIAAHLSLIEAARSGAVSPRAVANLTAYAWRVRAVARGLADSAADTPEDSGG